LANRSSTSIAKLISVFSLKLSNLLMKMIEDIRAENMRLLSTEVGGNTQLAERLKRSESQVSQWINRSKNFGTGKPRGMRSGTARWIESQLEKPLGWLDQEHSNAYTIRSDDGVVLPVRIESAAAHYIDRWPFPNLRVERVAALPRSELEIIEQILMSAIAAFEARQKKHVVPNAR
jgi:hypothetical protein